MNPLRGGSYWDHTGICRAAYRNAGYPEDRDEDFGFRTKAAAPRFPARGACWFNRERVQRAAERGSLETTKPWGDYLGFRTKA